MRSLILGQGLGAWALRSLVAGALRLSERMQKNAGAVRITRVASLSHCGQSCGRSYSAIGRMSVNGPQSLQRYIDAAVQPRANVQAR